MFSKACASLTILGLLVNASIALADSDPELVLRSEITLQPLNPLRGDASPKAGVLWGDIKQDLPTGTLVQFRDGFSSPPHIHNITYRAVVIQGEVHNDDPDAANLWMEPGSFWTQPAGEVHITSARGNETTIFLEIMEGPYLVQPSDQAFDNGERPVNIAARHIVWLDASDVSWVGPSGASQSPEISFLWGEPRDGARHGAFVRFPAGYAGILESTKDWLKAVTISGKIAYQASDSTDARTLDPGSYLGSDAGQGLSLSCSGASDCIFYVTAKGKFSVTAQ